MTVFLIDPGTIRLAGTCGSDDADLLLQHLVTHPDAKVDWRNCDQAHSAVIQVLLAADCRLEGPPSNAFLELMISPALRRG